MAGNYWTERARLHRRTLIKGSAVGGLGLAGMALAGCGDDAKPTATSAPAGGGTAAATPVTKADPSRLSDVEYLKTITDNPPKDWDDKDIKVGGRLTRLSNREPATLDWHTTLTGATAEVITPVYNGLVRMASRQGLKDIYSPEIEPDLASAWETPDAQTLIFALTPGVKYQNLDPMNGRDFTSDDIKFSIDRAKTLAKSVQKANFTDIAKVEADAGGKVRISLSRPNGAMLTVLATWFSKIMPPEIGNNPDVAAQKAVGTGGFQISKRTPKTEIVFDKNPSFFKKDKSSRQLPYIDGYTLSFLDDPATISATFQGGKAEFYYVTATPLTEGITGLRQFMIKNPDLIVQKHVGAFGSFANVPHYDKAPFDDVRVRRALSMAYNRQAIIDTFYLGQGLAVPFFPWTSAFDKKPSIADLGQYYKYDPKGAKALLAAAGTPNLEVTLNWAYAQDEQVVLFQQNAADVGIKVNLVKSADQASHLTLYQSKGWKDLIMIGRGANYPDFNDYVQYFTPGSPANFGNVNDPDLTALMDKQTTLTGDARRAVLKQILTRMLDQVYEVVQPFGDSITFWRPSLKNWIDTGWNSNAGTGSGSFDGIWKA